MKLLCSLLFLAAVALPLSYGDGSIKLTANTQSYLQVPPFLLGGDMTIESWVKLNGKQGSWARLFDFRESSDTSPSTQDILVAFSGIPERDLQAQVYIPGNVYQLHAAELKLPLNVWMHIAFTIWVRGLPITTVEEFKHIYILEIKRD
mmetsp:Transcript_31124/g.52441  ORF Transcript_31124/g.52441 Transcript_31124/m.52441 type:complete len:148 (-) Transcript_31124:628-1071(-)